MSDEGYFNVFVRNWWQRADRPGWPDNRMPDPGARKTYLARGVTYEKARQMCEDYARTHKPGKLSRKAEFEACRN